MNDKNHLLRSMLPGGLGRSLVNHNNNDDDDDDNHNIDPTLDTCCQREIKANRKRSQLAQTLSQFDITTERERRKQNCIRLASSSSSSSFVVGDSNWESEADDACCRCCYDSQLDGGEYPALMEMRKRLVQQQQQQDKQDDNNGENDPDEFDDLLDDDDDADLSILQQRRRQELEYQFFQLQVAQQHGYGTHRQIHPSRIWDKTGLFHFHPNDEDRSSTHGVVLHLFVPDSNASARIDILLEQMIRQKHYYGTIFMRSSGREAFVALQNQLSKQQQQRRMPNHLSEHDLEQLPMLLAIRNGAIVGKSPRLVDFVIRDDIFTDPNTTSDVERWLDRAGVLERQCPVLAESSSNQYNNNDNHSHWLQRLCRWRPEQEALWHSMRNNHNRPKSSSEQPRFDCGVPDCHKPFAHQHVGIQNSVQDGWIVPESQIILPSSEEEE